MFPGPTGPAQSPGPDGCLSPVGSRGTAPHPSPAGRRPEPGCQAAPLLLSTPLVSQVRQVPSGRIAYSSAPPPSGALRVLSNTIAVPSGVHTGASSSPLFSVSRVAPLPSAFITYSSPRKKHSSDPQVSPLRSRTLLNAIRAPSGDQAPDSPPAASFVDRPLAKSRT